MEEEKRMGRQKNQFIGNLGYYKLAGIEQPLFLLRKTLKSLFAEETEVDKTLFKVNSGYTYEEEGGGILTSTSHHK